MPYTSPPDKVKNMPSHAQEIWTSAFNSAWKEHEGDESTCHAIAYAAVKNAGYKEVDGKWIKESVEMENSRWYESCDADVTLLEEAAVEGQPAKVPRLLVTVIREGFSANTYEPFNSRRHKYHRFYTPQAVADVAGLIEGKSAYVGPVDSHGGPRTLKDSVVGVFENARVEESEGRKVARAEIAIYPDHKWIAERARLNPRSFGPSIEANGNVVKGSMEGRDAAIVETVTEVGGALLVENPAAGGAFDRLLESQQTPKEVKRMYKDLTEAEQADVLAEARKLLEAEADYKAKDEKIKALEEANKKLEDEKKAAAAMLAEAKSRELLEAAFPKDLPQVSKDRLYEDYKGETDAAKITEAVKKEAAYVAAVAGGVTVSGAPSRPEAGKAPLTEAKDKIKDALGLAPKKEEVK